jgi:tetratricopeptide (TPR) repeat protein
MPAVGLAQGTGVAVKEAERLAAQALATAATQPDAALAAARKALALTAEFQPLSFVRAGRKGEVVEDEYTAARAEYRRHRAPVYEAMGAALAAKGNHPAAVRYLRRALALDPTDARAARLVASLLAQGQGAPALEAIHARGLASGGIGAALVPLLERAVDLEGRGSVQVEIDLSRLAGMRARRVIARDGPVTLPAARLSTGAPLRLEAAPTVFYIAGPTCATCSEALESIKAAVPEGTRVLLVPAMPEEDRALRQVVELYKLRWPIVLGSGVANALGGGEDRVVVVARSGWIGVTVPAPFDALPEVLAVVRRDDLSETRPRAAWNRRPVERKPPAPAAGLLPEGFATGDDGPPPPEFDRALAAYRAGRYAEALRLFDALAAQEDGWLLPPEARLDRAIAMAALGRRDEARRIVLRIGDARLEDAADQALDRMGARGGR